MTRLSPIQRLLGLPAEADSPFDLLGLKPGEFTDAQVHEALERRLARLAEHGQGASHDGDEVRLALHAAAAQLLDPTVRAHLIQRRAMGQTVSAPTGSADHAALAYRQAAIRVIALSRRLDRRSRRLLIGLAHAYGLTPARARSVLRSLRSGGERAEQPQKIMSAAPTQAKIEGGVYSSIQEGAQQELVRVKRKARAALLGTLVVAVTLLAVAGVVFELTRETTHHRAQPAVESTRPGTATAPGAPAEEATPTIDAGEASVEGDRAVAVTLPQEPVSIEDAIIKLQTSIDLLATDPGEAAFRFDRTMMFFAREWTSVSQAEMHSIIESIVEYFYRAAPGGEGQGRALAAIVNRARTLAPGEGRFRSQEVLPSIWAVGMLNRLARGQDLSAQLRRDVDLALATALVRGRPAGEATFINGVHAALRAALSKMPLTSDPGERSGEFAQAWAYWLDAALWPSSPAHADGDVMIANAIELFLVAGASPALHSESREVIERLLEAMDWESPQSEARSRMLAWFDNPQIPMPDLAILSQWVINAGHVAGAGPDAALTSASTRQRRRDVRDELATLWNMRTAPETDSVALAWRRRTTEVLAQRVDEGSWLAMLWHAAIAARLNEAASHHWQGQTDAASHALEQAALLSSSPVTDIRRGGGVAPGMWDEDDGAWAVSYLSLSRNDEDGQLDALRALESGVNEIGPVDGDVLAEAAFTSSSSAVRLAASLQLVKRAHQRWALNGALEALLKAPQTETVSDTIESMTGAALPQVKDPGWRMNARRALVEALLNALSEDDASRQTDKLAQDMGLAYAGRMSVSPGTGASMTPSAAAARVFQDWLEKADQVAPSERGEGSTWAVERRMDGRLRLTTQPIGRFCATQSGIAELMAIVIAAERPGQMSVVERVISELSEERRRATSVIMQIRDAELAQLRLWMIRYGLDPGEEDEA